MKWYSVAVEDRLTDDQVVVGSMLTFSEAKELIKALEKFNSTDLYIFYFEENMK